MRWIVLTVEDCITQKIEAISEKLAKQRETITFLLVELESVFVALKSNVLHRIIRVRGNQSKEKGKAWMKR